MVIAAHPDDEVLGCGGTIARLAAEGWEVHVIILAEGATSRSDTRDVLGHQDALSELATAAEKANNILGSASLKLYALPDNRMDSLELLDVIKLIEAELETHKPCLVFTHHSSDVNVDHRIIHDAVIAACRPQPQHFVKTLLFFEVASSTEWRPPSSGMVFAPNYFYDISNYLEKKLNALGVYASEMRDFPHPRSIKAVDYLAHWRGATVGCDAAEAFILGRAII
jgi:LmbE family N-acetylglucosaminyl deacetylase